MVTLRRKASKDKGKDVGKSTATASKVDNAGEPAGSEEPPPSPRKIRRAKVKEEEAEIAATSGKADDEGSTPGSPVAKVAETESADAAAQAKRAAHAVGNDEAADVAALAVGGNAADEDKDNNPGGNSAKKPPSRESSLAAGRKLNGVGANAERGGKDNSTPETTTATKPKVGGTSRTAAAVGGPMRAPQAPGISEHVSDNEGSAAQIGHQGEDDDNSSDDDGDGFRIVVGREREAAPAPAAPVKRFLRGTNTLVNTPAAGSAGESRGTTSASKPLSAAAGIASLVPSKGATVTAPRPLLRPGEYPPTAELQRAAGRSAFDVDIDGLEEQPWRHPGVDVADYFNYGFTEDSWRVYCEKQLRNRFDQFNRVKPVKIGSGGGGSGGNHMRHVAGGPRRGGPEPPRPMQQHNSGPQNRGNFPPQSASVLDVWGPGLRAGPVVPGNFGPGPPTNMGGGSGPRPWFDGPGPSQGYPGGGPMIPQRPGGGQGRGGGMDGWNGDMQGGDFRPQDGNQRDSSMGVPLDGRGGGNRLMDGSGTGGVKRSRSPTHPRRAY